MSFSHAIIAPQGPIRFLEGAGEFFYEQRGGLLYPIAEPESYPNPDYNQTWIQDMWKAYQNLGHQLFTGDILPYYSLFDEETENLYIYQKILLDLGYTPLSFESTQELMEDQCIFFTEYFPPSP
jgi:hypothetical protein